MFQHLDFAESDFIGIVISLKYLKLMTTGDRGSNFVEVTNFEELPCWSMCCYIRCNVMECTLKYTNILTERVNHFSL